jgi:hypothetical protein
MKKFLIISDGSIGQHLIKRIITTFSTENAYYIVQTAPTFDTTELNQKYYKFYFFDPTSQHKLSELLKEGFAQAFVAMQSATDTQITVENIRNITKQLRIIVLDQFDMTFKDSNVVSVNANDILASRFMDYLPNVPVIAQNVGLGEGEIMEVLVPFGSTFVYRHIGVIEQRHWRIVGLYRNSELIIPTRRTMIQPNDLLLMIGKPAVLKSVYRAIKRELGQFPAPYGTNTYLYIDMDTEDRFSIENLLHHALFVYSQIGNSLIIRVFNPSNLDTIELIKSYRNERLIVEIFYGERHKIDATLLEDIKQRQVGLILVSSKQFSKRTMRKTLYQAGVPVLKVANKPFEIIKKSVVTLTDNRELEKISTAVFDISSQFNLDIDLINYMTDDHAKEKAEIIEHYNNLAMIFSKSINIIDTQTNPVRLLNGKKDFIQCLPFSEKLLERPIYALFSIDVERLYYRIKNVHQLFIPVKI